MADFPSTNVRINSQLSPYTDAQTFPLFDTAHGLGGLRTVGTTADLNNIFDRRRVRGMMVYVSGVSAYYALIGTTANSGWTTEFQMGTGTNILPLNNTFTGQNIFTQGVSFDSAVDFTSGMELRSYGLTVISSDAYQNTTFEKNGQTVLQTGTGVEIPSSSSGFSVATGSTFDGTVAFSNTIQGTTASFSRLVTASAGISASFVRSQSHRGLCANAEMVMSSSGEISIVSPTNVLIGDLAPNYGGSENGISISRASNSVVISTGNATIGAVGAPDISTSASGVRAHTLFTASSGISAAGGITLAGNLSGTTASFSRLVTATQGITSSSLNTTRIQAYGGSTFDSDLYVGATLTVAGNFIVNGTTTTINSTTITVDDKLIELAHTPGGSAGNNAAADGGGIQLNSSQGNKTFTWVNATGAWTSSEDFNLLTGKVYEINGTSVLSSSTLGSGITTSSLQAVGTISSGVWQGTVVGATYGGTGRSTYTIGDVLYANGTSSLTVLGASTAGRLLSSNGAGAAPEYKQLIIRDADATTVATESSGTGTLVMTIQNASTTVKGLARFDPLNFTVSGLSASVTAIDGGSY
jgi:hypothetical protein